MQERSQNHSQGIDVSHWQGDIDWVKVKSSGKEFIFIKATEGSHYVDPLWEKNAKGAIQAGMKIGPYHFARFTSESSALAEANHFIQTVQKVDCELPHVLDLEITSGLDKTTLSQLAKLFLDKVQKETGHDVMLYTNTNMAERHLTNILKEYPLWIAHYGVERPSENVIWKKWRVFQYTSKGKVPGIKGFVDLDEMAVEEKNDTVYKIRKGDTFWELEEQRGYRHGTLQELNPGLDPRRLKVGETIKMPK